MLDNIISEKKQKGEEVKEEEKAVAKLLILITMGTFTVSYFASSSLRLASEQGKVNQVASQK